MVCDAVATVDGLLAENETFDQIMDGIAVSQVVRAWLKSKNMPITSESNYGGYLFSVMVDYEGHSTRVSVSNTGRVTFVPLDGPRSNSPELRKESEGYVDELKEIVGRRLGLERQKSLVEKLKAIQGIRVESKPKRVKGRMKIKVYG